MEVNAQALVFSVMRTKTDLYMLGAPTKPPPAAKQIRTYLGRASRSTMPKQNKKHPSGPTHQTSRPCIKGQFFADAVSRQPFQEAPGCMARHNNFAIIDWGQS